MQTDDQLEWIAKYLKHPGKTPDHKNDICNHGIKKIIVLIYSIRLLYEILLRVQEGINFMEQLGPTTQSG